MKTAQRMAAQGDVLFRTVPKVPKGFTEVPRKGPAVVAHSETGHHHVVEDQTARLFEAPGNSLVAYLQLGSISEPMGGGCDVLHQRPFDTHETLRLLGMPGDVWEIRKQREHAPEGWRRVQD